MHIEVGLQFFNQPRDPRQQLLRVEHRPRLGRKVVSVKRSAFPQALPVLACGGIRPMLAASRTLVQCIRGQATLMAHGSEAHVMRRASPTASVNAVRSPTLHYRRRALRPNHAFNTDALRRCASPPSFVAPVNLVR